MSIRSRVAPTARQLIKAGAAAGDAFRRPAGDVTILIYHRVGAGTGGEMDLDPAVFDEQLAWLRANRRVMTLDQALAELSAPPAAVTDTGGEDGSGGVVLTFDDGTSDWVEHVLPALERHQVPATFYVATDFVERQLPFPGDGQPISWDGLAQMASSPLVSIGSHTHRHQLLDRLPDEQIDDELDRSIDLLRERLGVDPHHFCYPKAVPGSDAAERAVRQRFRTAVLAGTRPNPQGVDPYRLHRSPIQRSDGSTWFRRKATGGMHLEDDLRRGLNRLRYRGLSS